jgi:hypothetical protein
MEAVMETLNVGKVQTVVIDGIGGPSGADRLYITNGIAWPSGPSVREPTTYGLLMEPTLEPGKFRRAIAQAAWSNVSFRVSANTNPEGQVVEVLGEALYDITAVDADWDDETHQIELRVTMRHPGFIYDHPKLSFQVMTFCVA